MTKRVVGVAILLLLAASAPAFAVGPLDGAYQILETSPGLQSLTSFLVIIQNDADIGLALLFPEGFWVFGSAQLVGGTSIQATLFDTAGLQYGSINVTIVDGRVTGSIEESGVTYSASGQKFR
jgi:hypothetical protein